MGACFDHTETLVELTTYEPSSATHRPPRTTCLRRAHEEKLRAAQDAARRAAQEAETRQAEREQLRAGALEQQWATVMDAAQAQWRQVSCALDGCQLFCSALPGFAMDTPGTTSIAVFPGAREQQDHGTMSAVP